MAEQMIPLEDCGKEECINYYKGALKIEERKDGYSIGIRPKNIKIEHISQTTGIMLTCLMCKHHKQNDMYMQKSLIIS